MSLWNKSVQTQEISFLYLCNPSQITLLYQEYRAHIHQASLHIT
nr:MAG TPA: hypothetical protein [Caudoviricetes sp.]